MVPKFKHTFIKFLEPVFPFIYYFRFRRLEQQIKDCFKKKYSVFFFFPAYHMGGAEKIHLEILNTVEKSSVCTFICYKSSSDVLKKEFESRSDCFIDFSVLGNYKSFQDKLVTIFSKQFNRLEYHATIFGCNVFYFYNILDQIDNAKIKKVDLVHAFSPYIKGIEQRSALSVANLNVRVVINKKTKKDFQEQYQKLHIPHHHLDKIEIIFNPLHPHKTPEPKSFTKPLRCLWVARGSKEKRPWIYLQIAKVAIEKKMRFQFSMIGDVEKFLPADAYQYLHLYGPVYDPNQLQAIYREHDLLITTSVYEGFPLTVTEAICNNLVNISTNVGGISEHIKHGITGFLVDDREDETQLVSEFVQLLSDIDQQSNLLNTIAKNAYKYICDTFSETTFKEKYSKLLIHES